MTSHELANFKFYLLGDARAAAFEGLPADRKLEIEHVVHGVTASVVDTLIASRFTGPDTDRFLTEYRGVLCRIASKAAVTVGNEVLEVFGRE